jgi:NDP-sugar pyrophosphorylase family protein
MFTGIQILDPEIFQYIPRGVFSHSTTDVYPPAIADGRRIASYVAQGKWFELSTLQRYLEISLALLAETGEQNHIGKNCRVSKDATLTNCILWDNVTVDAGATLNRVVIADGVKIGAGEVLQNAAVVPSALVEGRPAPEKAQSGLLVGNNFVVPITR